MVEESTQRADEGTNWKGGARGREMSVLAVTRRGGEFLKIPFHSFCMSWITFPLSIASSFRNTADENIVCVRDSDRERGSERSAKITLHHALDRNRSVSVNIKA